MGTGLGSCVYHNALDSGNLAVVNTSNPDQTAVESTLWEIQLLPDGVLANALHFWTD